MTDDVALDKHLSLQIEAPKDDLAWGDEALVRLTAANTGTADIEAGALNLQDQPGIAWGEDFKGQWLELGNLAAGESRVIEGHVRVDGSPSSGTLSLYATLHGHDVEPAEATAALSVPGREPEEIAVSKQGDLIDAAAGRVQFSFPDGWNEIDAQLTFHLQEQFRQERGDSGRLLLFSVAAAADDSLVEEFDKAIEVTIDLSDLVDPEWSAANRPVVSTRQSEKENWTAVESKFDPEMGVLSFSASHFSLYQVTTEPQLWKLLYNPPGTSPYSGAATYQYPLSLPPGIAGLAPDLTLAYSSRPAEGMRQPAMSQGLGAGWGLPSAQINNGNAGNFYTADGSGTGDNKNYDPNSFTLVLNGMNYYLNPLDTTGRYGTFKAIGSPDLYIEYVKDDNGANNTDNVSGEFWRVKTADGTVYTFGQTADAEQVVWPMDTGQYRNDTQFRNPKFAPYNWKLNRVVDVHGNKIEYIYEAACGIKFDESGQRGQNRADGVFQCTEVDAAVQEIRYNFNGGTAQTKVIFTNEKRNYAQTRQEKSMTAGVFRPTQIDVRQGATDALVGSYKFTYSTGAHYVSEWAVATEFWMLTEIQQFGANGTSFFPKQTFAYNRNVTDGCVDGVCVKLLTEVANGYGAVTVLSYANWAGTRWQHVTQVETWDGVAHKKGVQAQGQTRTVYTRPTGTTACFDTAGSGCTMGTAPPSEALVGFDKVSIDTKAPAGGSNWTTVAKSETEFINANYLLLGKTYKYRQLNAASNGVLSEDVYNWAQVDSPAGVYPAVEFKDDQLISESHTLAPSGTSLSSSIAYIYEALNPAGGSYGALSKKEEKDEAGAVARCTTYAYTHRTADAWLVNRLNRETVYQGTCTTVNKLAETLYRYFESTNPTTIGLDTRARLTYVLQLRNTSTNFYSTEKRTYTAQGLLQATATFSSGSSTTAYATDTRNTTTTAYNALGIPTTITTTATGVTAQTQTIAYDTTFPWLVAKVTDSNGVYTQYGYDLFGRLSMVAMPGDSLTTNGATVRYDYYDDGAPYFVSPLLVGVFYKGDIKSAERLFYDGLGRPVQTQTAKAEVYGAGDQDVVITTAYDARGLAVCQTIPYAAAPYVYNPNNPVSPFQTAACSSKARTTTAYDDLGRVTLVTTPDGVPSTTGYGVTTTITVDGHSRFLRTSVYDGNNHVVNRYSDVFGRLVLVREFTGNSQATYANYADTRYSYDALGNLTGVGTSAWNNSQPSSFLRETTMHYDALGRKTSMSDPDMGQWAYQYDTAGNLLRQQDPSSVLCFHYDNLNRLTQRFQDVSPGTNCPPGGAAAGDVVLASYTYDTATKGIGKPATVSWGPDPSANKDTFTYDGEGRLATQTRVVNGQSFLYQVTAYDLLDRPTSVTLPDGEVVVTTYDKEGANKLTAGGTTLINSAGYNERGQLAYLERANGAPATTLSYHGAIPGNFRLNKIVHGMEGSDALPDFIYGTQHYDAVGNLTGMQMKINTGTATTDTYSFYYDEMNRLTTATLDGPGAVDYPYAYDRLGNIAARTGTDPDMVYSYGSSGTTPAVTGGPQAVTRVDNSTGTDWSYDYDERGNLDGKYQGTTLTHDYTTDVENRLASVRTGNQTMSFAYDAAGQRVMTIRHDGTIIYTPFPDYEVEDPLIGANTVRTTYRVAGQMVALRVKDGTSDKRYYTYTDHLGNVVALSEGSSFVSGSLARYDPFGNYRTTPATTTNPAITNHGFTGHRHNNTGVYPTQNVGLIYMNARYYLPEVGRFISPDTIVPEPANPQSYNRYAYGYNNPVKFVDLSGHYAQCSATGSDGFYANCDEWMQEAIRILGLEGGLDGARLAELFLQWFNDPGKMLHIKAYYAQAGTMRTRQYTADTASIFIDMNVISGFDLGDIALLGHELEHVSQGTWQAWSIQGEVLAYQVEFRIRESMGVRQSSYTNGAMGIFEDHTRASYDASSYHELLEARTGFLDPQGGLVDYNVWYEPNLPWPQETDHQAWQAAVRKSLITNAGSLIHPSPR